MPRIALLPIALLLLAASPGPIRYMVDTEATSVSAKVAFLGLASKTAQFPKSWAARRCRQPIRNPCASM